jgi:putative ABC transport system permease protein
VRYRLSTINDVLSEVEEIVRVLNIAGLVILLVLFAIIMVGVTNTFRIVLFERIQEIGTMRAVGMQRSEVRNLFLLEALFLGLAGIAAGYVLSGVVMFSISQYYWGVDTPLFMLLKNGYMTFRVAWWQVVLNSAVVLAFTLAAALRPANKAAKLEPAVALSTEM